MTKVPSSFFAGAEMMTFLAPPSMWACALVASVKKPVDSTTTSAPTSPHEMAAGSFSAKILMVLSPTVMESSVYDTSSASTPSTESYLSRCAMLLLSIRSLAATISTSAPDACTARKKLRPMRPKPLIPTRTVTVGAAFHLMRGVPQGPRHLGVTSTLDLSMTAPATVRGTGE
jgi:hypothetical protein